MGHTPDKQQDVRTLTGEGVKELHKTFLPSYVPSLRSGPGLFFEYLDVSGYDPNGATERIIVGRRRERKEGN